MNYNSASYVRYSGLGSGIDTDSLVKGLMKAYSAPLSTLQNRQSTLKNRLSVFQQFKGKMSDLSGAMTGLAFAASGMKSSMTNSNSNVVKVTGTGAASGNYDFKVFQLAKAQRLGSNYFEKGVTLGQDSVISVNGKSIALSSSDNMSGIADKINKAGAGVKASVTTEGEKERLELTSEKTGASNGITVDDLKGDALYNLGILDQKNTTSSFGSFGMDRVKTSNYMYSTEINTATGRIYGETQGGTASELFSVGFSRWDVKLSDLLGLRSTDATNGALMSIAPAMEAGAGTITPLEPTVVDPSIAKDDGFTSVTPSIQRWSSAQNDGALNSSSLTATSGNVTSEEIFRNRQALRKNMVEATGSDAGMDTLRADSTFTLKVKNENGTEYSISYKLSDTLNDIAGKIMGDSNNRNSVGTIIEGRQDLSGNKVYTLQLRDMRDTVTSNGGSLFAGHRERIETENNQQLNAAAILDAGQDARYSLNGVHHTSASNYVDDAISGAVVELLSADANGASATVGMTVDGANVKSSITAFTEKFNALNKFVDDNSKYNGTSYSAGALLGDSTSRHIQESIQQLVFDRSNDTGTFKSLAEIGFGFKSGELTFDQAKFDKAMSIDSESVNRLFKTTGTASGEGLSYFGSTTATQSGGPYDVNVSRLATQSKMKHHVDGTFLSQYGGSFTFKGGLFGEATISVDKGATVQDVASQINNDSKLKNYFDAKVDENGLLEITSKNYGADSSFSMTTTTDAASGHDKSKDSFAAGVDVQGTIGGKSATGRGQTLTGADGLAVQYAGSLLGKVGTIKVTKGAGSKLNDRLNTLVSDMNASFGLANSATQSEIDDLGNQMTRMQESLDAKEQWLRARYDHMDKVVGRAQSQGQRLYAMIQGLQGMQSNFGSSKSSGSDNSISTSLGF